MEVIIPPRDHRPTTYRYTWDQNGEVERVERVSESVDYTSARQTLQWPFLNTTPSATTASKRSHPLVAATQPRGGTHFYTSQSSPSTFDRTLVPDYVVNYLRGETPETVALRASLRPHPRGVDVRARDAAHRSRAADFYFSASASSSIEDGGEAGGPGGGEKGGGGGGGGRAPRLVGWNAGIAINALISFGILILGALVLTLAVSRSSLVGGEAPIYTGPCSRARQIDLGLRALVGVLAVALLAAANYAYQVLSSPTRLEVAAAHGAGRWLDIGVPSVRNLRFVSQGRVVMAIGVMLASFSIHVLYNSTLFIARTAPPSAFIFVMESFPSGAPFSNTSSSNAAGLSRNELLSLQGRAGLDRLTTLSTSQCLTSPSDVDYTALLVVTDLRLDDNSLIQTIPADSFLSSHLGSEIAPGTTLRRSSILSCIAEEAPVPPQCSLRLSGPILGVTTLLNLILVTTVAATALLRNFHPLATLGDALASFLEVPDPTTANACLLTKRDVKEGRWPLAEAKYWVPAPQYWLSTPSVIRWGIFLLAWGIPTGLAAAGLGVAIRSHPEGLPTFGAPTAEILIFNPAASRAAASVLASLPHILSAVLYFTLNALLSTYFVSHELSAFAVPDAQLPLRVSSHARGAQITSLYITLPRPYSWLVVSLFAVLSFTVSSSLVVVAIDTPSTRLTAISPSPAPLLATLCLLLALLALPLLLGFRTADPTASYVNGHPAGNPLALALRGGTCSAVLSAKCHPAPPPSPRRPATGVSERGLLVGVDTAQPVSWGVICEGVGMQVGRTGFMGGEAGMIGVGRAYA